MLQLSTKHLQAIRTYAESTYPEECCGLLIGKLEQSDGLSCKILVEVRPVTNVWSAEVESAVRSPFPSKDNQAGDQSFDKSRRYWIDPRDMLEGQRYARDRSLEIIGIYHSHPDHPAVPSQTDQEYAWSQYSYIIVSVHQGSAQDLHSWSLDDQHTFQPEEILTVESVEA